MDKKEQKIRDGLKEMAGMHGPPMLFDGTVTAIDSENYLADVLLDDGKQLFDIRLRAQVAGNQSIDVLPAPDSAIVVLKATEDDYVMLCADEITSYRITVADTVFTLDSTGTLISKGDEKLSSILSDLVDLIVSIGAYKDVPGLEQIKIRVSNLLK